MSIGPDSDYKHIDLQPRGEPEFAAYIDANVEEEPPERPTMAEDLDHIQSQHKKSFFQRNISPIRKGGLRSSLFTMFSSTMGAGLLSLPYILSMFGVTLGLGFLVCIGLLGRHIYHTLNELINISGKKTYPNVVSHFLGLGVAKFFSQFMILCATCSGILYASVSWQFLCTLLRKFEVILFKYSNPENHTIDQYDPLTVKWRFIFSGIMIVVVFPFFYQKSLATLRYISTFILVVLAYTVLVVVIEFPEYLSAYKADPNYSIQWYAKKPSIVWFQGLGTMMLSYYSQILFFYVRNELVHKSNKRLNKLVNLMCFTIMVFLCTVAVLGYIEVGDKYMPTLFSLRPKIPGTEDYLMTIAQVAFNAAAILKISLMLFPAREQIYNFYKIPRKEWVHILLTLSLLLVSFALPAFFPNISSIMGIIGGVMMGTAGYSLPILLKVASFIKDPSSANSFSKVFHVVLLLGIVTVQVMAAYVSIKFGGGGH